MNPSIPYLREDLIRAAQNARRDEEVAKWKKMWPSEKVADLKNNGELVLIFQQGWGPVKKPHPNFPRVPKLYPTYSRTTGARLEIEGGPKEKAQEIVDVTEVAIKQLDEQYAGIIGMRVAGIATKAVVSDQIRQKNQLLGDLAWIASNVADQADLRQWLSLPSSFQVAKVRLKPGNYKARVVGLDVGGRPTGEESDWAELKVVARKKTFMNWRSLQ